MLFSFRAFFLSVTPAVLLSCGAPPPTGSGGEYDEIAQCRFDPGCNGGMGALCDGDTDCASGFCCTNGNCAGGMCTAPCDHDNDCPSNMLCEHKVCFFACDNNAECAEGMSCEHDNTVCEWE